MTSTASRGPRRATSSATDDLAAARARIAELEEREAQHSRTERLQSALYRIAETPNAASDMPSFYAAVHQIVGDLMYAENFYIALYDAQRGRINYAYYVDKVDLDVPDPTAWEPIGVGQASGTTAYALRRGQPTLVDPEEYRRLRAAGEIQLLGVTTSEATWLGVPLLAEGEVLGLMVVQSYTSEHVFSVADRDLLAFVGQHVGQALARVRAIEETRQRNAELALVNEVGMALASQLDFTAIIDLVGDRISSIFSVETAGIMLYDSSNHSLSFPYLKDHGVRQHAESRPLDDGTLSAKVIRSGRPLRIGTSEQLKEYSAVLVTGSGVEESWLGVPILAGDKAVGVIAVERLERHGFSESDERLLSTLAVNVGVALENARLFAETKRLLTETDERAAELALLNSVQEGLAQNLDMQSMYDLVGDKIQEIFDAQVVDIGVFDFNRNVIHFPYTIERGVRFPDEPVALERSAISKKMLRSGQVLLINDVAAWDAEHGEQMPVQQGEPAQSVLVAPLNSAGKISGRISLQNLDRTNAFSERDVRLLSTLATTLSVALDNARLFDETKRLLAETDERAAELAMINSVQQGLARNLDMQSMYDLVRDKIQEIFDAQVVDIGVLDRTENVFHFPYTIERGVRFPDEPLPLIGFRRHVVETREPLLINERAGEQAGDYGQPAVLSGEPSHSILFVPLIIGDEVRAVISLQNLDHEHAFSESDVRLLTTLASSLSVALENARLFDETKRLLTETDERAAELAMINSVQQGLAQNLDMQSMYELVGGMSHYQIDTPAGSVAVLSHA
jgi:GAF domain-containing protein